MLHLQENNKCIKGDFGRTKELQQKIGEASIEEVTFEQGLEEWPGFSMQRWEWE